MEKPTAKQLEVYDLLSLTSYVSKKYNLNLNDMDVWHWFVDAYEPDNGSQIDLNTQIYDTDKPWVKEMKKHLQTEFGDEIPLLVEW